jgi:methylenetetrahydrofolate reductase (NADPH)
LSLAEVYAQNAFVLSFELYPPKTLEAEIHLFEHIKELIRLRPHFITCTYGAAGSTRAKTLDTLERIVQAHGIPVASHLTCVGCTVDELRAYLDEARRRGIQHIVAIRGDPPQGDTNFVPVDGGLHYANELVSLIRREFPHFGIAVGGYPEKHPEAASFEVDLENLKRKVDAGADVVITQLFYSNDDFLRFRDDCRKAGINVPVVPGILPITNYKQIQRITALCGAKLPRDLVRRLDAYGEDLDGQFAVGVYHAARQVDALIQEGIPGVHFYVLNKSHAAAHICRALAIGANARVAVSTPA